MSLSSSSEPQPFPESSFITLGVQRLHLRTWKSVEEGRSGRILLLHGFGGSTYSWRYVGPRLSAHGYYVVAVDLPGFGYSSGPAEGRSSEATLPALMWGLADRLESISNGEGRLQWILVGHSSGGQVAAGMAAEQPERVERSVYIATVLFGSPRMIPFVGLPIIKWLAEKWIQRQVLTTKGMGRLLGSAYGRPPSPEEIAGYLTPLLVPGAVRCLMRASSSLPELTREDLVRITQPSLVVWGEKDAMIDKKYALRIFGDLPKAEIFIIQGAGHLLMETHVDTFLGRLEKFLGPT